MHYTVNYTGEKKIVLSGQFPFFIEKMPNVSLRFNYSGGSSLTNEKDHHYFLNRFVCVGEFFDG